MQCTPYIIHYTIIRMYYRTEVRLVALDPEESRTLDPVAVLRSVPAVCTIFYNYYCA